MKKVSVLVVVLLLISLPLVSASFLGDIGDWIRGLFVKEEVGYSPELVQLSASEQAKIAEVKISIGKYGEHPDYSSLYGFLETEKGNGNKILRICEEFDSIFCLKKACEQNPEMRKELSKFLGDQLREEYSDVLKGRGLEEFVEGHEEDCMMGIPQFVY